MLIKQLKRGDTPISGRPIIPADMILKDKQNVLSLRLDTLYAECCKLADLELIREIAQAGGLSENRVDERGDERADERGIY